MFSEYTLACSEYTLAQYAVFSENTLAMLAALHNTNICKAGRNKFLVHVHAQAAYYASRIRRSAVILVSTDKDLCHKDTFQLQIKFEKLITGMLYCKNG
jgi:hypothetical protein